MYQVPPPSRSARTVGKKAYLRLHKGYQFTWNSQKAPPGRGFDPLLCRSRQQNVLDFSRSLNSSLQDTPSSYLDRMSPMPYELQDLSSRGQIVISSIDSNERGPRLAISIFLLAVYIFALVWYFYLFWKRLLEEQSDFAANRKAEMRESGEKSWHDEPIWAGPCSRCSQFVNKAGQVDTRSVVSEQ